MHSLLESTQFIAMQVQCDALIAENELADKIATDIRCGGPELIEELAPQWCDLWEQVSEDVFYRPDWILAYLRSFETKPVVWLVTAFIGDRLVAVLPLVKELALFRGLPVRQLRGAACVHSVRYDLLRAPGALGTAATTAIWHALEQARGWDLIYIPFTPANGNAIDMAQRAEAAGFRTATDIAARSRYINIVGYIDGSPKIEPSMTSNFRCHLRRWGRRSEQVLGTSPELVVVREAETRALKRFYELEASGWKGQQRTAIICSENTRSFYSEAARIGANLGRFRLAFLQANGRLIAAAFGIAQRNSFMPLKIGCDEALPRCAPGHLLIESLLKSCCEEGIAEFEFGGQDEHYKSLWTPHTREYLKLYLFNRGAYGWLLRFHKLAVVPKIKNMVSQFCKVFRTASKERSADAGE